MAIVAAAVSEALGCEMVPYAIMPAPPRIYAPGISGNKKLTGRSRCQPRECLKMNRLATDITLKNVRLNPMYKMSWGNGVKVISMAHTPCAMMAVTGVCHFGFTAAAALKKT